MLPIPEVSIPVGEHIQTFFSMSYWVNLLPKIQVADPKRERKKTCNSFLSIFGVYTSIFGVENFKKNLFTNSCFIRLHSDIWYPCWPLWQSSANKICEQLGSLFLDLLHWNIFQARQHSWKDFAPPPTSLLKKYDTTVELSQQNSCSSAVCFRNESELTEQPSFLISLYDNCSTGNFRWPWGHKT